MSTGWTEISTSWQGELGFTAQNEEGATIQVGRIGDTPGIGPMQLLLVGVATCTGMDIVSILKKKRIELDAFQVRVRANRADTYPMVYTEIQVEYLLWGEDLKTKDVEQAIELSEDKYCSASIMMRKAAPLHSSYRILKPGEKAD
ncbi:MAG: OsmC family protein [Anaerolineales bacterium]|nr:OsmC family protein [Anaerolineales bacterium]